MNKGLGIIAIALTLSLAACNTPLPTVAPTSSPPKLQPIESTQTEIAEIAVATPIKRITRVLIDGIPSDWADYPLIATDPIGDSNGNVDVTELYAFANKTTLYVMFKVAGEIGSYVQVDLDINPTPPGGWPPDYMINTRPYERNKLSLARIIDQQFSQLGEMGNTAQREVIELRLPLSAFTGLPPQSIAVRIMDGICCEDEWKVVDSTEIATIAQVNEDDPPLVMLADLTATNSAFCSQEAAKRQMVSIPAEGISLPQGYQATYLVPSSGVNVPSDVVATSDGKIFVASSRADLIQQIEVDGSITDYAHVGVYSIDQDAGGNLYGYSFPGGVVFRITPRWGSQVIAKVPRTAAESTLAVAPDGTLFVGVNLTSGDTIEGATIYRIPSGGGNPVELPVAVDTVSALDVISDGKLYAVLGNLLATIDPSTGELSTIAKLPAWGSFHGLAVTDDGTAYVASGDFATSGALYRVTPDGKVTLLATFADNGLEGLAISPDGWVIGVQRIISGIQAVAPDGIVRALVPPNGLTSPQALAISPCGEVLSVNDEAGRLVLIMPDGHVKPFTQVISFQPPQTFLAFSPQGWYVVGESAPGFPSLLNRYLPNGVERTLVHDVPAVSGVAVDAEGSIYVSSTANGTVMHITPDGKRRVLASNLNAPEALALSPNDLLYAVSGGQGSGDLFSLPSEGEAIVMIAPDGTVKTLATLKPVSAITFAPDGTLYAASGKRVYRLTLDGVPEKFAEGFAYIRGLAFDLAGNLLVADDSGNAIVRISGFEQGRLTGEVKDAVSGSPLAGVSVRITLAQPPFPGGFTLSDAQGRFSLPTAPGKYWVTAWKEGYLISAEASVLVTDGQGEVNLILTPTE